MTTINPVTRKAYVHFGDVRLACGENRYFSTPTTTTVPKVSCPDCRHEITRFGAATVLANVHTITDELPPVELNGHMHVLEGWKRIDAARELGLKDLPCVVHLPDGVRNLDGMYVLGNQRSLDKVRFAVINKDTRKIAYKSLEVQTKQVCDICDESLKGDESVGIAPHDEEECEEKLDIIMSRGLRDSSYKFGFDLPDSQLQDSLTRVLKTRLGRMSHPANQPPILRNEEEGQGD